MSTRRKVVVLLIACLKVFGLTIGPWPRIGDEVWIFGEGYNSEEDITIEVPGDILNTKASLQGTFSTTFIIQSQPGGQKVITASSKTKKEAISFWIRPWMRAYPLRGSRGTRVFINGWGYPAGERVQVGMGFNSCVAFVDAGEGGTFSSSFIVGNLPYGSNTFFTLGRVTFMDENMAFFMEPDLRVTSQSGNVGSIVTLSGTGYKVPVRYEEGEFVRIDFGTYISVACVRSDKFGSFELPIAVPIEPKGKALIQAEGISSSVISTAFFEIIPRIKIFPSFCNPTRFVKIEGDGFSSYETITMTLMREKEGTTTYLQKKKFCSDDNGKFNINFLVESQPIGIGSFTIEGESGFIETRNLEIKPCVDVVEVNRIEGTLTLRGAGFMEEEGVEFGLIEARYLGTVKADKEGSFLVTFLTTLYEKEEILAYGIESKELIRVCWDEGSVTVYDVNGILIGTCTVIQDGINDCPPDGKVLVVSGIYRESVYINKRISLIGQGNPVIDPPDNTNGITFDGNEADNALISGFTITGAINGILCINGADVQIINNIISGNGQGIFCDNSSPSVTNNTIVWNGYGIYCQNFSFPIITNNIIVNNSGDGISSCNNSLLLISSNNIWKNTSNYFGCSPGSGDISSNPKFIIDNSDYHLQPTSLCINAGSNTASGVSLTDKDGNPRISHGRIDMGAYEYQGLLPSTITIFPTSGQVGTMVEIKGQCFASNDQIRIDFGNHYTIATAIISPNGTFSTQFYTDTQSGGTKVITATDFYGNYATTIFFFLKPKPSLLFSPKYQLISEGGYAAVDIFVLNIYQFFGLEAYISFNPNILQVSTITGVFDGWLTSSFDNTLGIINVGAGINMGDAPITGSITIARVFFDTIGTGTEILNYGTISPRNTILMDMDGPIGFDMGTASIEVPPLAYIKILPSPATVCLTESQVFCAKGYTSDRREIPGLSYTWNLEGDIGTITEAAGSKTTFIAGRNPGIIILSVSSHGVSTHTQIFVIFSTATVKGKVVIDTGGEFLEVSSITLRLTEDSTRETKTTQTALDGTFLFSSLIPGTYTLFTDITGASPATRTGILVLTNQTTDLGTITLLGGDSDNDGRVRILDFYNLYFACPSREGDANYNPNVDFDYDRDVDGFDFQILYRNFFKGKGLKKSSLYSNDARARFVLSSSSHELKPGDRFDVLLKITGIDNLIGLEVSLSFDKEILQILEIKEEGLGWLAGNLEEGSIILGINPGNPYLSGGSKIAQITFIVKKEGKTKITVRDATLIDKDKNIIPFSSNGIELEVIAKPSFSALGQSFPNPASKGCWIPFQLASDSEVVLEVYNILGQRVRRIEVGERKTGFYTKAQEGSAIFFDQKNDYGEKVSSGLYFYRLRAGNFSQTKALLVK
ncbi:MAG: right-handed parallel beta-helix repeat-containing protein [bacterium]